jgi:hypothetical protein
MAVVPSSPIVYEALPLFLIPTNWRQMTTLVVLSDVAYFFTRQLSAPEQMEAFIARGKWVMLWFLYIPTLLMILRRPNEAGDRDKDWKSA